MIKNRFVCGLLAVGAALGMAAAPAWANVYASGMERTAADTISYVLNEDADVDVTVEVWEEGGGGGGGGGGMVYVESLGPQAKGPHSWTWNGTGGLPGSMYKVKVRASANGHYAWGQISVDQMSTSFYLPLGVSVDKSMATSSFGTIYVSSALAGTTTFGRLCDDGIYALKADMSDAGFYTGGKVWTGNSSPMHSTIGPDGHLYVCDLSYDTAYEFSADMSTVTALNDASNLSSFLYGTTTYTQWVESIYVEGTQAAGDRKIYLVDSNYYDGNPGAKGLVRYELGGNSRATSGDKGMQYIGPTYFAFYPRDVARDSAGNWYMNQYRYDPAQAPAITKFYDSLPPINTPAWETPMLAPYNGACGVDIFEPRDWVAYGNYYDGFVHIVHMSDGTYVGGFDAGTRLWEVAFDAAGNVYTVDSSLEWLRVWSPPEGFNSFTTESWFTITIAMPLPPIIAEVTPDPDTAYEGEEYVEQLVLLQGDPPIMWTLEVGPTGAYVDQNGRVAGWTPGPGDVDSFFDITVSAHNTVGSWTESWQVLVKGFTPYPEYVIASTADQWVSKLESMTGVPAITPVESMTPDVEEELALMEEPVTSWRPARLYVTGALEGRDALVMAFGDTEVPEGQEVVAAFDYAIGSDNPGGTGDYGFYSETHNPMSPLMSKPGPQPEPTWCNWYWWRRVRFSNYWYFWPWQGKKWIVFYDINGNRLMMDYYKWWPRWPWWYRYWWPYRVYPWYAASWYYYPYWGWQWWYWWQPWSSWYVDPGFMPWRVVRVRYWERAYWFGRPPPLWWGGPWPWPWLPMGKDGQQVTQTPPNVPWNAWGDMAIERPEKQPPRLCDPMNPIVMDVEGGGSAGLGDGDVDLNDFGVFQGCFNGPNRPYAGAPETQSLCACFDRDNDDDVDLTDFSVFQACFNGPNRPVPSGCAAVAY